MLKNKLINFILTALISFSTTSLVAQSNKNKIKYRKISVNEYRDKLQAGWLGQIVGVTWGSPTEFKWSDKIIPEENMPKWDPKLINKAFNQDDLYVEMTFLRSLEEHGLNITIRQAGIDFANSEYRLWCANEAGRNNLRAGIAPPDCSHPAFNNCPNDIDYQIESDYSGLIAPGMPNVPIELGEKFGRLMNYGDGMYAGQFVGAMYTEAFFETEPLKIIDAAIQCIPYESQYAEMVRDVVKWYKSNPDNWETTWKLCQKKYREDPAYQRNSNGGIDVKINGAYILIGLLYGKGDLDKTVIIATRCGQDSDCNPSNAAGVLFTTLGASNLPLRFKDKLDTETYFSHTSYNFPKLLEICEKFAREYVLRNGGKIEIDTDGKEYFIIPKIQPNKSQLMVSWDPGPTTNSLFSTFEMSQITYKGYLDLQKAIDDLFPKWVVANCGSFMSPGYKESYKGRKEVIMTHPLNKDTPCLLSIVTNIPNNKKTTLKFFVSHHDRGDWELVIRINGSIQKEKIVSSNTVDKTGWLKVEFDLTPYSGNKNVHIELENKANNWTREAGYWSDIKIESI